jgi:hypothetical protein
VGDIINYKNGYYFYITSITKKCREFELKWSKESVKISVCKDKGVTNNPVL